VKRKTRLFTGALKWAALAGMGGSLFGGCGPGALGLQDFERDILVGLLGGLATAILMPPPPPADDTTRPEPGPPGPQGPPGPPGPPIFAAFVDTFFRAELDEDLSIVPVRDDDPQLGVDSDTLGFSVAIPANFQGNNPLNLRVLLFRSGPCTGNCFVFSIDARRFRATSTGPECLGGEAPDCADGQRRIRVPNPCADGADAVDQFLVIDLPLSEAGLRYTDVQAGDLLAFEFNTLVDDGGTYELLGVELSDALGDVTANADIFFPTDTLPEVCSSP